MNQLGYHEIINDVNLTLKNLLELELKHVFRNVSVRLGDLHNLSQGDSKSGVNLFLYEIVLNEAGLAKQEDVREEHEDPETGETYAVFYPAPVRLSLHYIITPFASDPQTEYRLLGRILQIFQENAGLQGDLLKGEALGSYPNLRINPDTNLRYERLADIFRAFNERPKLSAGYAARVELFSTKVLRRTRLVKERRAAVRRT